MKVRCIQTSGKYLDSKDLVDEELREHDYQQSIGIEIGDEFVVMGVISYELSGCLYYLTNIQEHIDLFPYFLFEFINDKTPKNWHLKIRKQNYNNLPSLIIGFEELCHNSNFLDRLIDGDSAAGKIFFKRKKELLHELRLDSLKIPDHTINETAQIADATWLICPICIDAWECTSKEPMVICPKCDRTLHNPRWIPEIDSKMT